MKKAKILLPIAGGVLLIGILLFLFLIYPQLTNGLTHVPRTEATCFDGNIEYWYQASTGKYFSDADGKNEMDSAATVIAGYGHSYGSWEEDVDPTIYEAGSLIRTCERNNAHTETCVLPPLDAKNGYTVSSSDGESSVTLPTFASAGSAFYSIRKANQVFTYLADMPSLTDYYTSREDAILVSMDEVAYTGGGASYDSASETLILKSNTDTASLTVTAPSQGFYEIYLKYANKANNRTMMSVYNDSVTEWTAYAHTLLKESEKTTDMTYELRENERLSDFPAEESSVIFLREGENDLRLVCDRQIGIAKLLFVKKLALDDANTVLHPYGAGENENNGYKFNEGGSLEIPVTVPADGTYKLYAMMSTTGGSFTLDSKEGVFPSRRIDIPELQGGTNIASMDRIKGTYLYLLDSLPLTAGAQTLRFGLAQDSDSTTDYFHTNYLALVRTGDIQNDERLTVSLSRELDPTRHSLSLSLRVSGVTAEGDANMTVALEGYYTHEDGSETPFSHSFTKADYDQAFAYQTTPLTGDMDGVSYRVKVYNKEKTSLLYTDRLYHYSVKDSLTVFLVTDMHHTGSNLSQLIRKYHYPATHAWAWSENVLKTYNSNSTACDIYGMTTDEKVQRIMDDVIQRYEAGEFDIVLFLGDQSMNDGNYMNFSNDHIMYENGSQYGESLEDFWTSPLNLDLFMTEQYFSQLADHGIPFLCANGNHDYLMDYNEGKTAIDYTPYESRYHYQELFGHKDADGHIYDATPVDFFVRVIRRDGEVKLVSALSSAELEDFKATHQDDWNCYDHYVSEDTLCDSDIRLGGLMMVAPYQIESFDYYMDYYVYMKDPITGEADKSVKDFHGQTYRSDYHTMDVIEEMTPMVEECDSVYLFGHNFRDDIGAYLAQNDNIRAMMMGDLHTQVNESYLGLVPKWVCGACVGTFDVSYYYERDPETGALTKTPDKQYWNKNSQSIGNGIAGNFVNYPYSSAVLHIRGSESYIERENISFFYENTQPSYNIMFDRVVGWDPMYERAVDYTKEAGTSFKVGDRTVYVGGDTFIAGDGPSYINIARSYTMLCYNEPEYMLAPLSGMTYTLCDTAGRPLNANGKPVVIDGGTAATVTLSSTDEGTALSLFGNTYYTVSKSGGAVGHYLYDENGDFVYVDENGDLVFYDFYKDENGDFMTEYFYEDENGGFVPLGYWNDTHTAYKLYNGVFTHEGGSYTDENGVQKTSAGIWLSGDVLTISRLDHTHSNSEQLKMVVNQFNSGKYKVTSANITIENGVLVRGEGFVHRSYTYRFVDAYGNEVEKASVKRTQMNTWTYTLIDRDAYTPGDKLTESSFQITANGFRDIYGMYIPRTAYEKTWLTR